MTMVSHDTDMPCKMKIRRHNETVASGINTIS